MDDMRDETLRVRIDADLMERIDGSRLGEETRSQTIRRLLDAATKGEVTSVFTAPASFAATPAPTDAQTYPAPPVAVVTDVIVTNDPYNPTRCRGGHIWRRGNGTMERLDGRLTFACECGCGERRYVS